MLDNTAIFLMGPTASGKTDLVISLSKYLPIDIISVDSALIYKDMNIGTAKPSIDILNKYPHALVDIISPEDSYDAARFVKDANNIIKASLQRNKIPVLVGGSIMYYYALINGLATIPDTDADIKLELRNRLQTEGQASLYAYLCEIDAHTAVTIQPEDSQRTLRALEVFLSSGKSLIWYHQQQKNNTRHLEYNIKQFALELDRSILHERINKRFDSMVLSGLIDEVEYLTSKYNLNINMPSIRVVGYRQAYMYLQGNISKQQMLDQAKAATRSLAKRQITWLRSWDRKNNAFNKQVDSSHSLIKINTGIKNNCTHLLQELFK